MEPALFIGIDVGGTFTDVVAIEVREDQREAHVLKVPTSRANPAQSVLRGLEMVLERSRAVPSRVFAFLHGTTVATNAIIERSGGCTALVTTEGFRDVLEIGRLRRAPRDLYRLVGERDEDLVPRHLRLELKERTAASGEMLAPVDERAAHELAQTLQKAQIDSLAVVLLNAPLNSENELSFMRTVREVAPSIDVTLSHEVLPEIGEYERTCATVLNAYLFDVVTPYILDVSQGLTRRGIEATPLLMQSNGGVIEANHAARLPVRLLLSGPAGGVAGCSGITQDLGMADLVTFDMGGTSCDVGLITDGDVAVTTRRELLGMPVALPSVDIVTIGTGGGSIAWVDDVGRFRVGPRSAGAEPGPAAYGRGGADPTVTDADVVLGYVNDREQLGDEGNLVLDADAAGAALRKLGRTMGSGDVVEVAWAILEIAHTQMVGAIRTAATSRGLDLSTYCLVAYGGAGPVHAVRVARSAGISTVVVPRHPGCHSAHGLLFADRRVDAVEPLSGLLGSLNYEVVLEAQRRIETYLGRYRPNQGWVGHTGGTSYGVDARYRGQQSTIIVPIGSPAELHESPQGVIGDFQRLHRDIYGYADQRRQIELVALRAALSNRAVSAGDIPPTWGSGKRSSASSSRFRERMVYFGDRGWSQTPVYERSLLSPGRVLDGPGIIEQADTTTLVPPDVRCNVVSEEYLVLEIA